MCEFVEQNQQELMQSASQRMEALLELMDSCQTIADIGCDHGKLCKLIMERGIANDTIASDISDSSLQKARELFMYAAQSPEFRVGNGLQVLNENEAQGIVIAGMGGRLIASILDAGRNYVQQADWILCQPMQQVQDLRLYLRENQLAIVDERIVFEENRYYEIIKIDPKQEAQYPAEIDLAFSDEVGPRLWEMNSPILRKKLQRECDVLQRKLLCVQTCNTIRAQERKAILIQRLEQRNKALEYLEKNKTNEQ